MVSTESKQDEQYSEKKKKYIQESIAFNDDDLEGITQPHNDAGSYRSNKWLYSEKSASRSGKWC